MNSPSLHSGVLDQIHRLNRRVRWKRWLGKLNRFAWLIALTFLALFLADALFGLGTLSLRIASGVTLFIAIMLLAADWLTTWLARQDTIGLAHLLEKRYPELAERLVTLVQIDVDEAPSRFAPLLRAEAEQQLAGIDPTEACPLASERNRWLGSAFLLAAIFVGISFVPAFGQFSHRYFHAWTTPLVPFEIEVSHGNGYALRGGSYQVAAAVHMLDEDAVSPSACELVCEDDAGEQTTIPMQPKEGGHFAVELKDLRQPMRCRVHAGEVKSEPFEVRLIDAPAFRTNPTMVVHPPKYLAKNGPKTMVLDAGSDEKLDLLRFSQMQIHMALDRLPRHGEVRVQGPDGKRTVHLVQWNQSGTVEVIAANVGIYHAEFVMDLEHGLTATLPLGQWTVRDDAAPQFTQPLRLSGGGSALLSHREYRIAPDELLKLQTEVEDDEGLDSVAIEIRINDDAPRIEKWLNAVGKKKLAINDWLPLPSMLKEKDRVQFRLHASDNRRLKKGEVVNLGGLLLPQADLLPQVAVAPTAGEDAWITLRVDRAAESLVKQQAKAQSDEVLDVIGKIKQKLQNETEQVQQLQRMIHQQSALTPAQVKQAEKLRALNREIAEDLLSAGERFAANPELANLADHFLDIAGTEMMKSAEALQRFSDKSRPVTEAEKELQTSQAALLQARKRLDRLMDLNKLLAQDRLDQLQLDKLAKKQDELAQRLEKLLADQPLSDAELAKQIEAIRQEQARLAEQVAQLQEQSRLLQDSLAAQQQQRVEQLAKEAQQLADEQKLGKSSLGEKADKLKGELMELAQKGMGPETKAMAKESAQMVDDAKKSMDAGKEMKAKGNADEAKKMDEDAAMKLDLAAKQLAKLSQDPAMKEMAKDGDPKTAEALKDSAEQMRKAEEKLPKMPKDAQTAMKSAAKSLAQAVDQASKQSASKLPKVARNPAAKSNLGQASFFPGSLGKDIPLEAFHGKSWGELPGELKTRMLQDVRARYGEEYAVLIRQYFERLAETPTRKE